jgi:hypothetical protein
MATNTPVAGYPQPIGDKYLEIFDHAGPSSYTQFSTPTTGGDVVKASDLGFGGIDSLEPDMVDTTGQFVVYAVPVNGGGGNAVAKVILVWYSLVTASLGGQSQVIGTQVIAATNLSTFKVRLRATLV